MPSESEVSSAVAPEVAPVTVCPSAKEPGVPPENGRPMPCTRTSCVCHTCAEVTPVFATPDTAGDQG